jgi:hypothetical protein
MSQGEGPKSSVPQWDRPAEISSIVRYPRHLKRTLGAAAVVGTLLFLINHGDEVLSGNATPVVWIKVAVTYLVPFCVANYGILVATRRPARR